jgi:hypothetical protein
MSTNFPSIQNRTGFVRYDESNSSFVAEPRVNFSSAQPSLMSRISADPAGMILKLPRTPGMVDQPNEGPSPKRRRIEPESSNELADRVSFSPLFKDSVRCAAEEEISSSDAETSSETDNHESLASSDSAPPREEARERFFSTDSENSEISAPSELAILAKAATVASLKMAVNTDLNQFKRLVRAELQTENKLTDSEWGEVFIDAVRKSQLDAVFFLLKQPCISPQMQIAGAREALRSDEVKIASLVMTVGAKGPPSEVELFLEEAASKGASNLIRLAILKRWVTDALANKLILHGDKLITTVSEMLAGFNIDKRLRGQLVISAIDKGNTDFAIVLLGNNAFILPSHRGKAARLLLEKKDYKTLEVLLNTKQLLVRQQILIILVLLKYNNNPRPIQLFRNYFQGIEEYRQFAAQLS